MGVLIPFGGGFPFDLGAVGPDGAVLRLQVKSGRLRKGCVVFNTTSTDHGRGRIHYRGRADLIAVSVAELDAVFVVPVEECPEYEGILRLEPTLNNQRLRVRLAADYTFEHWVETLTEAAAA